ncbi:MAG TPA: efflux RND transporter periplasmic adaptor subunit [Terriglobales bacterium]|nr:efflux RND transporter periplasmic adaptor subunit [Terriglobales bacterium]
MAKRMILMLVLVVLLIAGLGFVKFRQIEAATKTVMQPPPEAVTTIVAKRENWPAALDVIGTMTAVQGVVVSADLPGTVDRINFESGKAVAAGDVLVELDTRQERAQLAANEAQRDLAKTTFNRTQELYKQGVLAKVDYDNAVAQQKATEANVGEIRATIARKTIRAPFSGILGIRQVNLGQYLSAGQAIVALQSLNPIYVNFGIPQQESTKVKVGSIVRVTNQELGGAILTGRVNAIDSVVNEGTRNIQIQATLSNPSGKLRPGTFVGVQIPIGQDRKLIALPTTAINYAPYGDSVYVVTDMKDQTGKLYRGVKQQFVKIDGNRGDQVAVASGINPGDEIVTSGVFKLRNGAAVQVNNKIQPENNPAPKPEDS